MIHTELVFGGSASLQCLELNQSFSMTKGYRYKGGNRECVSTSIKSGCVFTHSLLPIVNKEGERYRNRKSLVPPF